MQFFKLSFDLDFSLIWDCVRESLLCRFCLKVILKPWPWSNFHSCLIIWYVDVFYIKNMVDVCRINSNQPWIQLHLSHEQLATKEYSVAIPVAVNFANQLNRMIKRRLPHFITENGKININKYRSELAHLTWSS